MYTQKVSGLPAGRNSSPTKTAPSAMPGGAPKAPVSPATASQTIVNRQTIANRQEPAVPRSVASLIAAAGLPADKLSASIISFTRFFSLPLKPELMAAIRQQAVTTKAQAEPTATGREALSLAAAAALDKGVEPSPKALEALALVIDPDRQKRGSGGRHSQGQPQKKEGTGRPPDAIHEILSAAALKEIILQTAEKDPLLALLNRLPGKNGQRWIVLPFCLDKDGREFRVSLRILLTGENVKSMVLDIAEGTQRWIFVPTVTTAKKPAITAMTHLTLYLQPELSPQNRELIARTLSQKLEIPPNCVFVNNMTEPFPCESGSGNELYAINEAV